MTETSGHDQTDKDVSELVELLEALEESGTTGEAKKLLAEAFELDEDRRTLAVDENYK